MSILRNIHKFYLPKMIAILTYGELKENMLFWLALKVSDINEKNESQKSFAKAETDFFPRASNSKNIGTWFSCGELHNRKVGMYRRATCLKYGKIWHISKIC